MKRPALRSPSLWSDRPRTLAASSLALALFAIAPGCGGSKDEPVQDFATAPQAPTGSVEYKFPETVIEGGTEVQNCFYMENLKEDIFVSALQSYQGKFGHHLVLFRTAKEYPPGTVRDCTSVADMVELTPVISTVNFGLEKFPDGMAVRVPRGTQMVLQQHVVNTSQKAIVTRDVTHLKVVPQAEVKTMAGFYGLSDVTFNLKPAAAQQVVSFSCAAPRDMNILLVGPHMHEWGQRIVVQAGPKDALQQIIDQTWRSEYRDFPPVKEFKAEAPLAIKKGDLIKTDCFFLNNSEGSLSFPKEMCATYGYYFPAPLGSEPWLCSGEP